VRFGAIPIDGVAEAFVEGNQWLVAEQDARAGDIGLGILDVAVTGQTVSDVDAAAG
jgi:hypothetical protein